MSEMEQANVEHLRAQTRLINAQAASLEAELRNKYTK